MLAVPDAATATAGKGRNATMLHATKQRGKEEKEKRRINK